MNQPRLRPSLVKFSLLSILLGSAVIFGCESTKIITKHKLVNKSSIKKITKKASSKIETKQKAQLPESAPIAPKVITQKYSAEDLKKYCFGEFKNIPGVKVKHSEIKKVCEKVKTLSGCQSNNGTPIFHYERMGRNPKTAKRILALSLIHGDEAASGTVSRSWMSRLENLDPRNSWRVIPIANPDGFKNKTRMNAKGIDINRNFPSADWKTSALKHWKDKKKSDPRKFPGPEPASEPETQCLIKHFKDFKPDFIISVHTPYGVLDFDGPPMSFPTFKPLPWISLGNYPGSLGRYMWVNNKVPVLTIELKGDKGIDQLEQFDRLQDVSGTVAIQATRLIHSKNASKKN